MRSRRRARAPRSYEDFNSDVETGRTPCPYNAPKLFILNQDTQPCPIHPFVLASAFANGALSSGLGCIVGGNSALNLPDCYTPAGAATICTPNLPTNAQSYNWRARARVAAALARHARSADTCALARCSYFGGASMLNEHLTFPPLPNNTNGNFPSWNGVGGVFNPLWYNSQGYSFHSYGKTGHQLQASVNSNLGIAINNPPAGQMQLHDDTPSVLDTLAGTNNVCSARALGGWWRSLLT
jgi:hypothetical protein